MIRGIRGATTVERDHESEVLAATSELMNALIEKTGSSRTALLPFCSRQQPISVRLFLRKSCANSAAGSMSRL